ncbi:sugar phosphate isomerase/epimerase [Bacillaceae bacterium SIJ1]|uniref:sugar phosphate isomerase/epimerase family protein n=1 Tax=Litoribacterium kuwaitense TaxID=1398745 RepID=UPI0013E9C1F0|nr:sugar phosphate isomerase/epimerase family protein [Litoribacterium kuwaitense]NGP45177.1 sugar phosphate isomerase/epimerase [Litoribacterium kuwaitense]
MTQAPSLDRLSLNQITTDRWSLQEAVDGCVRAEIPWISVWRHKIAEVGLKESKRIIADSGLHVSSICRGGMFPAATASEREERIDDNRRAIEEAAELGTDVLVLVCGPAPDRDIAGARQMVADGIEQLIPFAESHGVKLGIEPLHPMYAADRSVINTLQQANDMAEVYEAHQVGVVVDVFHVWWDPYVYQEIQRASGHILGFHVSDWIVPVPDLFKGRGMMGDGVIELRKLRNAVEAAGYQGPIEVEIINQAIWDQPGDDVLALMKERYKEHV